ncbi:putative integral membrane protein [Babesia bovis T2Bo]|uniref:putative integral membrane protein n=1 Tax=Babesia bovis T2Bo TaxID=484906 RepID=UPI001C35E24A|nr:putative integral membrane protein [Babesia bovis T2Bo]KAG6440078.1 putative integral membrane protein [Babesia bovis T2Bo]
MGFDWSKRPYTAPFLRDMIYNPEHTMPGQGDQEHAHKGEPIGQYKFVKHIPFANRVSQLPIKESQAGHFGGNGGCSSTLNMQSLVPSSAFGNLCSTQIRGSDIFFLPKPSQLLCFALPVFVLMPNLTVFARHWFFYAPK